MSFWDASAVLPLLVTEVMSPALEGLARSDRSLLVWWGTRLECVSALCRRLRDGTLPVRALMQARVALSAVASVWSEVLPTERVRASAERLLAVHPLRVSDALQLAAALQSCRADPTGVGFVCLDDRLRDAARREGFTVVPA